MTVMFFKTAKYKFAKVSLSLGQYNPFHTIKTGYLKSIFNITF